MTIDRDLDGSRRHVGQAREMFARLRGQSGTEAFDFRTGAVLHAMLAGHAAFEAGLKRLASLLGAPLATGADWHSPLLPRLAEPIDGMRPAAIDDPRLPLPGRDRPR